jgi:hypothetical protein
MKILIQDEHGVRELEEGYASEEELQTFLREHSELIPVDDIELGTPPILCIGWEVGVASGSEDLLYIDETGLMTVVETKLRKNPESRREVVGQILEYASYLCTWCASDIEKQAQEFFASDACPAEYKGSSLDGALEVFMDKVESPRRTDFAYEEFLTAVTANLERGHSRLVIAIDEPPDPLLRIVEFVNRFSERFEMYIIQLKRFHDKATAANIFVPALFGRVARPETRRRAARLWDKTTFLEQASKKCPDRVPVLERLMQFAESERAIKWGRGASLGTFGFEFPVTLPGRNALPAYLVIDNGRMSFDFWTLSKWLATDVVAAYRENLRSAKDIPAEAVNTDTWKEFDVGALTSPQAWKAFCQAVVALKTAAQCEQ